MDPVSAVGVAAATINFIDFTTKVISEALEIKHSASGATVDMLEIEAVSQSVQELTQALTYEIQMVGEERRLSANQQAVKRLGLACHGIALELKAAIGDLKAPALEINLGKKKKAWASFRQAIKSVWHKGDIAALEKRLDRMRQQLIATLLVTIHESVDTRTCQSEPSKGCNESASQWMGRSPAKKGQWKEEVIETICQNGWQADNDEDLISTTNLLSGAVEKDWASLLSKKLLRRLSFQGMTDRNESVEKAYEQTLEWVFKDPPNSTAKWSSFQDWLQNDAGIYWVTGKAGSGKSTLMKFIYNDARTKEGLKQWAGTLPVILSSFFFWSSGSKMQMSLNGLLQTLLYGALSHCPHLISTVFTDRWENYLTFGGDVHPWKVEELRNAFKKLISFHGSAAKFCFLIDGLDEFDGEHEDLVEWVQDITTHSPVKICVSSRPWTVFEDALSSAPSLRLQDLTYGDIEHYITTEFMKNATVRQLHKEEPEYITKLTKNVADGSSGVFLWVRLVVRSLLKGITNGDRASDIQRRLDDIPRDLEQLFGKMVDSIDPFYLEHASQLFQLVRASVCPPSVLILSFADEEDPKAVFKLPLRPLNEAELKNRSEMIRRRINSRCKGLLEAVPVSHLGYLSEETLVIAGGLRTLEEDEDLVDLIQHDSTYDVFERAKFKVEYLHRTVKDYLKRPEVWSRFTRVTEGTDFNPHYALCRAFVMLLKTLRPHALTREEFWYVVWMALEHAAQVEASTGTSPVDLLEEFNECAITLTKQKATNSINFLQAYGNIESTRSKPHWTMTRARATLTMEPKPGFLPLTIQCGLDRYVAHRLEDMLDRGERIDYTWLLRYAVSNDKLLPPEMEGTRISFATPNLQILRILLRNGASPKFVHGGRSSWEVFLACMDRAFSTKSNDLGAEHEWIEVMRLFIEQGASKDQILPYKNLRRHAAVKEALKRKKK